MIGWFKIFNYICTFLKLNNQCAHAHVLCALKNNCIVSNIIFNNEMLFYCYHTMGLTTLVGIFKTK
jgi:hypothetical protein